MHCRDGIVVGDDPDCGVVGVEDGMGRWGKGGVVCHTFYNVDI